MKWIVVSAIAVASAGVSNLDTIGHQARPAELEGKWLMTLIVEHERPVETVITFLNRSADEGDHPAAGSWRKIADHQFEIAFLIEAETGSLWRAKGKLELDELDRLRGGLQIEHLDADRKVIGVSHGLTKAKRFAEPIGVYSPVRKMPAQLGRF